MTEIDRWQGGPAGGREDEPESAAIADAGLIDDLAGVSDTSAPPPRRKVSDTPARVPTPKYASVSIRMPERSADALKRLAADSGIAFKHLTALAVSLGVRQLADQLAAPPAGGDDPLNSKKETVR